MSKNDEARMTNVRERGIRLFQFVIRISSFVMLSSFVSAAADHSSLAAACPFCNAVTPSFAERRDECAVLLLGEAIDEPTADAAAKNRRMFRIRQVFKGRESVGDAMTVRCDAP